MANKDVNGFLLQAFANANPSVKDKLLAGSVSDITKVDGSENYTGALKDADGNVISGDATWKPGNFLGVLSLDAAIVVTEQDTAGTTPGLFKKADGTPYIVLDQGATLEDLNTLIGYEFAEDQAHLDADKAEVEFATHLFTQTVPVVFVAPAFVNHVDLPVA